LCHDILHGDGLLYLELYRTDKVARVVQDDCGPTDGYMLFILLAALLQYCLVPQQVILSHRRFGAARDLEVATQLLFCVQAIVDTGYSWAKSYAEPVLRLFQPSSMSTLLHWFCPEKGWIKLNMDGVFSATSPTSIRGVFRDSDANWLCEFLMAFGKDFVFKAEVRAILKGLIMAWEKGFRQIEVECDNALLMGEIIAIW
ncbi:hypothetical protein Godav_027667, partial [Gossypium davidsonii]|nr:hypothetical protein [Gossypium davidsonii]